MIKDRIILGMMIMCLLNGCLIQPQICNDTRIETLWDSEKNHIKRDGSDYAVLVVTITNFTRESIFLEPFLRPQDDAESIVIEPIKGANREIGPEGTLTWKFTIYSNDEAPGTYRIKICVNGECDCKKAVEIVVHE